MRRTVLQPICTTLLLAGLAFSLAGCTLHTAPAKGGKQAHIISPMKARGAVRLSQEEAEHIAAQAAGQLGKKVSQQQVGFAISQSLAHAAAKPQHDTALSHPGLSLTYAELTATLRHMQSVLPSVMRAPSLLAEEFTWYRIGPDFGATGYYEPTLKASRTRSAAFPYPLYRVPRDLRKGVGYHTRYDIDRKGALQGKGYEIAWVSSEVDAFFLHVQGSGRLLFPDGTVTHVLYANKNNRAYTSLGRVMKERGLLAPGNVNMKSIREYLASHPNEQAELLDQNASYVFFREANQGPIGAMGRTLTPWMSLAVDRRTLPHGSLTFIALPLPDAQGNMTIPFYGLTVPQDVGGAIKGHRIDLFSGAGPEAEHVAGFLDAPSAMFVLVKKGIGKR